MCSNRIAFIHRSDVGCYCFESPFYPPESYSELPFVTQKNENNKIYPVVRELLEKMEMDKKNIGTSKWNPFKDIIKPGNKVVIKPNLVTNFHYLGRDAILSTITHGSIIRPIVDYVFLALRGNGQIIIADTPTEKTDFSDTMQITGIQKIVEVLSENGYENLQAIDLRPKRICEGYNGEFLTITTSGDPLGYATIDLGESSCFSPLDKNPKIHYYTLTDRTVDHFDPYEKRRSITDNYHHSGTHKYVVSRTILSADVIINIAKLKTHCKAGVSLSLKNMIGIVSTKDCMPHHRPGPPPDGDAFPDYPASYYVGFRKSYRTLRKTLHIHLLPGVRTAINAMRKHKVMVGEHIEHGNWKGNDTIWRTILDVNRIVMYADKNGKMSERQQRKMLCFIDGIIGQQGNAPISGEPRKCGVVLCGYNPVLLDAYATGIMGIDYHRIKTIHNAQHIKKWKLLIDEESLLDIQRMMLNLKFALPKGWQ
jgi:uncharacterized protein (DUF362 family)